MKAMTVTLVALIAGFALPAVASARGRSLALAHCAQCHVVAPDQGFTPPEQPHGPDFRTIARDHGNTAKHLRQFLRTTQKTPHGSRPGMPNPLLTNAQIDDLVSFILGQSEPSAP